MPAGFTLPWDKLEFVGMPPRAMRAFARVVIFPSAARPVRFCGGGLFYKTYAVQVEGPKGCEMSTRSPQRIVSGDSPPNSNFLLAAFSP